MAFLSIRSDNPNFSFVLRKNPSSGMQIRHLRKGHLFGWYDGPQNYHVYFKDAENEISYKRFEDEQYDYNSVSRYNSSMFVLNAITLLFGDNLKKDSKHDQEGFQNEILLNMVFVERPHYITLFKQHFPDTQITAEEIAPSNWRIHFQTTKSLRYLFNLVAAFTTFSALKSQGEFVDEDSVEKYLNCLNLINAPYFIRYVFKINFLRTPSILKEYRELIEGAGSQKINMTFGNTQTQRIQKVESLTVFDRSIVDVGCGEGSYIAKLANRVPIYIAIDKDEAVLAQAMAKSQRKNLENVIFKPTLAESKDDLAGLTDATYLLIEVLEHMPFEEATTLLKEVLSQESLGRLILTTPNKNFNQFYHLEEEDSRHDDHHFELTEIQFQAWIKETVADRFNFEFMNIGDSVDGVTTTLGAKIWKK